jgi:Matrixin
MMAVEPDAGPLDEPSQVLAAPDTPTPPSLSRDRSRDQSPTRSRQKGPRGAFVSFLGLMLILLSIVILVEPPWVASLTRTDRNNYAFLQTQPGSDEPVTWNHCRAIHFRVNPLYAPKGWQSVVNAAFDDVALASGFVFVDDGRTTVRDVNPAIPDGRTVGDPVLVMWSTDGRLEQLHGDVAGIGGSATAQVGGRLRHFTGRIVLDAAVYSRLQQADNNLDQRLILMHEIGHVLGLDHVDDKHQLMYAGDGRARGLGHGDVAGLEALHAVPCD